MKLWLRSRVNNKRTNALAILLLCTCKRNITDKIITFRKTFLKNDDKEKSPYIPSKVCTGIKNNIHI